MFYFFSSDKVTAKLFESFCSVNNIFSEIKNLVDPKSEDAFGTIGKQLNNILIQVKPHYIALIK